MKSLVVVSVLSPSECVTAWTPVLNSSQPMSRHPTYTEIPLVWSLVSYAAVGILKFTISIICVLVNQHFLHLIFPSL